MLQTERKNLGYVYAKRQDIDKNLQDNENCDFSTYNRLDYVFLDIGGRDFGRWKETVQSDKDGALNPYCHMCGKGYVLKVKTYVMGNESLK